MELQTFIYTVDPTVEEPIMLIDRHIGADAEDGYGIMGDMFQRELLALDAMDKKRIQVWINSPGGVVADGYNIYNAILKTKTKVDTYCIGIAASIAAVIFQAGRTRYMADYGQLMYHNPFGGDDKSLDAIRDSLATMISSRTGKPADDVKLLMGRTTWMSAKEALEDKFCDQIEASADHNKKRSISSPEEAKNVWKESNKILNNIFKSKKTQDMKNIANKLNLTGDSAEENILAEIERIQNKAKNAEERLKIKETEIVNLNKKVTELSNDISLVKAKREEEESEMARNMIENFVKVGRIKNDATEIESWIDDCKVLGIDKVKARIENLPLNTRAAKIVEEQKSTSRMKVGSVIANKMAELQANGKSY